MLKIFWFLQFLEVSSEVIPLYLNITNEQFVESNGYLDLNVKMGDKLNIICPKVNGYLATLNSTEPLFLGLWNVDQSGFNTCNAGKWGSRRMLRCNVPDFAKIYTLKIQSISAANVVLFNEGQSSYFIVPTNGMSMEDIESTSGGLCKSKHMRIRINVIQSTTTTSTISIPPTTTLSTSMLRMVQDRHQNGTFPILEHTESSISNPMTITQEAVFSSVDMWFGVLIGATVVMLFVLCGICVIYTNHKRQSRNKDMKSPDPVFGINSDYLNANNYQSVTLMKSGRQEYVTMERSVPSDFENESQSSRTENEMGALHGTDNIHGTIQNIRAHKHRQLSARNSQLCEALIKQNEIILSKEGFVVQV